MESNKILWICGKSLPPHDEDAWEFSGVFSTEDKAIAACLNDDYFIGPQELDSVEPIEPEKWEGAYYPHAIKEPT